MVSQMHRLNHLNNHDSILDDGNELGPDLPPSLMEDDTYGILARTLPLSGLPTELVLTADIFETRLQEFDKTAVLFYLGCEYMHPITSP